jgi:hypothetical protein
VPVQNPVTRLEQVALGLERLAQELEAYTGEPPANILWWRQEILEVVAELERDGSS